MNAPPLEVVGTQFVQFYYQTFDADRSKLQPLYQEHSKMTFEGVALAGVQNIVTHLKSLPFRRVQHRITSCDVQPSGGERALLVFVTGDMMVDDAQPVKFTQAFHLIPTPQNQYWVHNDIFRVG